MNEALEKEAANKLINDGCVLVSQHADSMGAPTACEKAGVPNVSYNGSTQDACPNTFIVSSRIDWTPYYVYAIKAAQGGEAIEADWTGNLGTGSVVLTDVNEEVAAEGTADKIAEITKKLEAGELQVFDITTFTVDGKEVDSYKADVDTDADYVKDTEVIETAHSRNQNSDQLHTLIFRSTESSFWTQNSKNTFTSKSPGFSRGFRAGTK